MKYIVSFREKREMEELKIGPSNHPTFPWVAYLVENGEYINFTDTPSVILGWVRDGDEPLLGRYDLIAQSKSSKWMVYPCYMEGVNSGAVIHFTGRRDGTVVINPPRSGLPHVPREVGDSVENMFDAEDSDYWRPVELEVIRLPRK